jgi:hypothetical protein
MHEMSYFYVKVIEHNQHEGEQMLLVCKIPKAYLMILMCFCSGKVACLNIELPILHTALVQLAVFPSSLDHRLACQC